MLLLAWVAFAALGPATSVQLAGWGGMLARDLSTRSVQDAVQRTFDGKHPCCMCETAAALREDDGPARRGQPNPELRTHLVHLALGDLLRWHAPAARAGERLPGWRPGRPLAGVVPDPDDPVPRFRV